jgi:dolichol kinase
MRLSSLELRRQLLHMFFGIILVTLLYFQIINIYWMVIGLVTALILSKLCTIIRIPLASWVMDRFERKEYRNKFPGKGPIFFMIGSIIVLYLFPLNIALAAMVILSVGDAVSHIFGKLLAKRTYKYLKSVEGTLVAIVASFFGVLIFVNVFAAIAGVTIGLFFEDLKIGVEDNLFLPIVAAIIMSLF